MSDLRNPYADLHTSYTKPIWFAVDRDHISLLLRKNLHLGKIRGVFLCFASKAIDPLNHVIRQGLNQPGLTILIRLMIVHPPNRYPRIVDFVQSTCLQHITNSIVVVFVASIFPFFDCRFLLWRSCMKPIQMIVFPQIVDFIEPLLVLQLISVLCDGI